MPYALNRGVRLYWEEHGSGPPILLIMGLSFTLEMWHRVLPGLSRNHRVILFDNRGMGRSDVPLGRYSMPMMARDAAAVMDAAGLDAAHVMGASMGGMIAQELTLHHPERVLSLVLGCTSYGGFRAKWPDFRRVPRNVSWAASDQLARERSVVPLLYADSTPKERIEEDLLIRQRCRWTREGFLRQFGAVLVWSSYRRLPRIRVPTLVIHGDQDRLILPQNGRIVARRIPGAQFVLIPNAAHVISTDQPEMCNRLILGFIEQRTVRRIDSVAPNFDATPQPDLL